MNLHLSLTGTQLITELCRWCISALLGFRESHNASGSWCDSLDAASMRHESPPLFNVYQLIICLLCLSSSGANMILAG